MCELILSSYEPHLDSYLEKDNKDTNKSPENKTNFLDQLPFDVGLNLSEKESLAKKQVKLPYVKAQNEIGNKLFKKNKFLFIML